MSAPAAVVAVPHGRVPPHDKLAERALLGGILLDGQAFDDVVHVVGPSDFYSDAHRKIFEAMCSLVAAAVRIDHVSVRDALGKAGQIEAVGGEEYVALLDKYVPMASNLLFYAQIVFDKARIRRTIEAAGTICQLGYEQHGEADEFLDDAQRRILETAGQRASINEPESIKPVIARAFKEIETDYERGSAITGLASGLERLDSFTAGWQPGDLIILAARPSVGKTTCGLGFIRHAALHLRDKDDRWVKKAAMMFSMEMRKEILGKRLLAAEARVDFERLRTGQLIESDWAKLAQAAGHIGDAPITLDDERYLSALQIAAKARKEARKRAQEGTPLSLIVVDYLTLMKLDETKETESARIGKNTKRLKNLAGELGVPIVLLAQLNRENAKGGKPRRPVLTDLRSSGEIEQDADIVVFIHEEVTGGENEPKTLHHSLIVEKQRNGKVGDMSVNFTKHLCRFDNPDTGPRHFAETGEAA